MGFFDSDDSSSDGDVQAVSFADAREAHAARQQAERKLTGKALKRAESREKRRAREELGGGAAKKGAGDDLGTGKNAELELRRELERELAAEEAQEEDLDGDDHDEEDEDEVEAAEARRLEFLAQMFRQAGNSGASLPSSLASQRGTKKRLEPESSSTSAAKKKRGSSTGGGDKKAKSGGAVLKSKRRKVGRYQVAVLGREAETLDEVAVAKAAELEQWRANRLGGGKRAPSTRTPANSSRRRGGPSRVFATKRR